MFWRVLLVCVVLFISMAAAKMQRIPAGVWGGQHIQIEVGEKLAKIEYDCASGVIDGPLAVDSHGSFRLRGTHRPERGGPIRADDDTKGQPATYTGSIKNNTMTLTLKVGDSEETFTLEKGKEGELVKCK